MFTEEEFHSVQKLLIRYLKRTFDVYDGESVLVGLSYDRKKKLWYAKGTFDQRHTGTAQTVDYCSTNPSIEKNGPWLLEGWAETPEKALAILKKRINKLLVKAVR